MKRVWTRGDGSCDAVRFSGEPCGAGPDAVMVPGALPTAADLCLKSTFVPLLFKDAKSWESRSPDRMPSGSFSFSRSWLAVASTCTWEGARADRLSFPDRWTRCSEGSRASTSSGFFLNESA